MVKDKTRKKINETTTVLITGERSKTTCWVHSDGMVSNHGMPDLELRDVPIIFVEEASRIINEINAHRLEVEVLMGQTILVGELKVCAMKTVPGAVWNDVNMMKLEALFDSSIFELVCDEEHDH